MRSLGSSGVWELFLPASSRAPATSTRSSAPTASCVLKADPYAQEAESRRRPRRSCSSSQHRWDARRRASGWRPARRAAAARAPDLDLRGPPRLVAAELARGQPAAHLPRARRRAVRVRQGHGLHPRRAAAGDGTTRSAARGATRSPATSRPRPRYGSPDDLREFVERLHAIGRRRDPRLGPRPLPARRVRARAVRRHGAVRARRPAPRRAPRLGHAGVQLRPPRGPQLPDLERAVLAARVPRRRDPRRRGRVDAVPRLLAQRGRVGPQPVRRPRGPRRGRVPQGAQRGDLRPRAGRSSPPPRSRPRGRASRARPTSAGSASASSGTWAGCTTRSPTSSRTRSTAATTTTS